MYRFDQIVALLKEASKNGVLPYFIFRLFSLMRTEEMKRFTEIHPSVKDHPLISLEAKRISITNQIFKKRSDTNHRGRFYNEIQPAFPPSAPRMPPAGRNTSPAKSGCQGVVSPPRRHRWQTPPGAGRIPPAVRSRRREFRIDHRSLI